MSNQDAAITPPVMAGSMIPAEADRRLTPEQKAFAEVLGRKIAQRWAKGQSEKQIAIRP
jgi:hypothetical protein